MNATMARRRTITPSAPRRNGTGSRFEDAAVVGNPAANREK
jgi:hypothetical protein